MFSFKQALIDNESKLAIWGCGYIGVTSAVNFAINGVKVLGFDVNPKVVENINQGKIDIPNLDYWIGFPVKDLVDEHLLKVTQKREEMNAKDLRVHLIAVPTEKEGEPYSKIIREVFSWIAERPSTKERPDLVIIESTLTPRDLEKNVIPVLAEKGKKIDQEVLVGVAPRRDWFHSPEKNMKNLPRVFGANSDATRHAVGEVLSVVCDHLLPASSVRVAELVKSVENSLLHVPSVYAMQLSRAFPGVDINEVLRLVGTHWRIPTYYPSIGTGGYCIPVSSKYVKLGADAPEHLSIIDETIAHDAKQSRFVAERLHERAKGPIGVLGIAYKGDLKVHALSPALKIIQHFHELRHEVMVHDPYYSEDELRKITDCKTFKFPDDLSQFSAIVIVPGHRRYSQMPKKFLLPHINSGTMILDNTGTWSKFRDDFAAKDIDYHVVGDRDWI